MFEKLFPGEVSFFADSAFMAFIIDDFVFICCLRFASRRSIFLLIALINRLDNLIELAFVHDGVRLLDVHLYWNENVEDFILISSVVSRLLNLDNLNRWCRTRQSSTLRG